jgi:hypothetical protein
MADNFGAAPKPYDYSDYYGAPTPGTTSPNTPAPGMGFMEKWRSFLNGMGISGTPVAPNATGATDPGGALRYAVGAAPLAQPTASQADVRKADTPQTSLMDRLFPSTPAPVAAAPAPAPVAGPGAVAPVAAPVVGPGALPTFPAQPGELELGQRNLAAVASRTMSAADVTGTMRPDLGTGAAVNTNTGRVIRLTSASTPDALDEQANAMHARGQAVYGVGSNFGAAPPMSAIAAGYGAALNQRHEAAISANTMANNKLQAEMAMKLPGMAKDSVEAQLMEGRIAAADRARATGADENTIAGILAGRPIAKPDQTVAFPSMTPGGPVTVVNKNKGTALDVTPKKQITMAEAVASAKKNKTYESDSQVRRDMAKIPGYQLAD